MRLILDAEIRPETVGRMQALAPGLEVVDVFGRAFDAATLADPEVEILVGGRAPADLSGVPKLRWLQVRSAGVDHLLADPPWRKGLLVTNSRGVFAVPIGEYVTGMVLRIHQPTTTWTADQDAHHWPTSEPPTLEMVRDRRAVIAGYGAIGREVARQLSALGMRIVYDPSAWLVHLVAPAGGLRLSDPKNRFNERDRCLSGLIVLFRHAGIEDAWPILYGWVLRRSVLLRHNVMRPWRQPKVLLGLLQATATAWRVARSDPQGETP